MLHRFMMIIVLSTSATSAVALPVVVDTIVHSCQTMFAGLMHTFVGDTSKYPVSIDKPRTKLEFGSVRNLQPLNLEADKDRSYSTDIDYLWPLQTVTLEELAVLVAGVQGQMQSAERDYYEAEKERYALYDKLDPLFSGTEVEGAVAVLSEKLSVKYDRLLDKFFLRATGIPLPTMRRISAVLGDYPYARERVLDDIELTENALDRVFYTFGELAKESLADDEVIQKLETAKSYYENAALSKAMVNFMLRIVFTKLRSMGFVEHTDVNILATKVYNEIFQEGSELVINSLEQLLDYVDSFSGWSRDKELLKIIITEQWDSMAANGDEIAATQDFSLVADFSADKLRLRVSGQLSVTVRISKQDQKLVIVDSELPSSDHLTIHVTPYNEYRAREDEIDRVVERLESM